MQAAGKSFKGSEVEQVEVMDLDDPAGNLAAQPKSSHIRSHCKLAVLPTVERTVEEIQKLLDGKAWLSKRHSVLNKNPVHKTSEPIKKSTKPFRFIVPRGKRKKADEDGWETMSESDSDEDDWEEQLVYIEIPDVPSIQELFAVHPNDFMRFASKRLRSKPQPIKPTHPKITIKFHQFDSKLPVVQIGRRYYHGQWKQPYGTALFFKKKLDDAQESSLSSNITPSATDSIITATPRTSNSISRLTPTNTIHVSKSGTHGTSNSTNNTTSSASSGTQDQQVHNEPKPYCLLKSILPDPEIPYDCLFGSANVAIKNSYELVGAAHKVMTTRHIQAATRMYRIPNRNRSLFGKVRQSKIPKGYTVREIVAGQYKPKKRVFKKRKHLQTPEKTIPKKKIREQPDVQIISHQTRFMSIDEKLAKVKQTNVKKN